MIEALVGVFLILMGAFRIVWVRRVGGQISASSMCLSVAEASLGLLLVNAAIGGPDLMGEVFFAVLLVTLLAALVLSLRRLRMLRTRSAQ